MVSRVVSNLVIETRRYYNMQILILIIFSFRYVLFCVLRVPYQSHQIQNPITEPTTTVHEKFSARPTYKFSQTILLVPAKLFIRIKGFSISSK